MLAAIVIIAVIAILLLIPISIEVDYDANGLKASVSAAFVHFKIYPKAGKALKVRQKKKSIKEKLLCLSFEEWLYVVKITLKALVSLKNRICVDRLRLIYVSADADPSKVSMRYAAVNAAASAILPLLEQSFGMKSCEVRISTDYEAERSSFELGALLSMRLGQTLYTVLQPLIAIKAKQLRRAFKFNREGKARHGQQTGRFNA